MEDVSDLGRRVWLAGWWAGFSERKMYDLLITYVTPRACPFGAACVCDPGDSHPMQN